LAHIEGQIQAVNKAISTLFTDDQKIKIKKLDEVEGVAQEGAEVIMAEMGINIKDFKGEIVQLNMQVLQQVCMNLLIKKLL